MKKRILSVVLVLALLCALTPQLTLGARAEDLTGKCGANLTWTFTEATGVLAISGSGAMEDFEAVGNPDWQDIRRQVKAVSLPDDTLRDCPAPARFLDHLLACCGGTRES